MKKRSIRTYILIPVILLGIVSIFSNIMALINLRNVNDTATIIADDYMVAITELDTIGQTAKDIHSLALSHIVATDFETMTSVVTKIEDEEAILESTLDEYASKYDDANIQTMIDDYQSFKDAIMILLAQSANQKTKDAYATANGILLDSAYKLDEDINAMIDAIHANSESGREQLYSANLIASVAILIIVVISIIAVILAIIMVSRHIIRPVLKAENELQDIIEGINRREGDLTKRITVQYEDEIGALSKGINAFIEHLQDIFTIITNNSTAMDKVVSDVLGSVQTSNSSASDLSALTEELSATMQEVANSASAIN